MSKPILLIADDEQTALQSMTRALKKSYTILEATDGQETWDTIQTEQPDLVLLDLNMPKLGGFQVLEKSQSLEQPPLVIMITAYGSERVAVDALKAGAYDYIAKPYELDELRKVLENAAEKIKLRREVLELKAVIAGEEKLLLGTSKAMEQVRELIAKVAPTDVTVLITGDSGTGKELVACAIHQQGPRAEEPFVALNCAALPKDLIESELFGYKKGAFTGAIQDTPGKFELAQGGTLFLDEIGDMSLDTQARVLRTIEDRQVTPLGSTTNVKTDVRILAATNHDLQAAIAENHFREDLYYRLRVVEIELPPLCQRGDDVLILADHFLKLFSSRHEKPGLTLSPSSAKLLKNYSWPGNVRELRNVIESTVVLSTDTIDESVLESALSTQAHPYSLQGRTFQEAKQDYVVPVEQSLIEEALENSKGNITRAADLLGMKRQYLQQKLKHLHLSASAFK